MPPVRQRTPRATKIDLKSLSILSGCHVYIIHCAQSCVPFFFRFDLPNFYTLQFNLIARNCTKCIIAQQHRTINDNVRT